MIHKLCSSKCSSRQQSGFAHVTTSSGAAATATTAAAAAAAAAAEAHGPNGQGDPYLNAAKHLN
jgi:hypothetical protein